jgi:prepilin-type N-terminal cleavage/methylation domain-containing protein
MFKTIKKAQKGFTIIELLIVIAIIAILALLVLNNIQGANAKARDQQRTTDLNAIATQLEAYYNENNFYPSALSAADLKGIDEGALKDPQGGDAPSVTISADATAADAVSAPTSDTAGGNGYLYVPYGPDCSTTGHCSGYRLQAYIEKPNSTTPNPYVKKSLN